MKKGEKKKKLKIIDSGILIVEINGLMLSILWRYLIKGTPVSKFTNKILLFVDDRIGIVQEIKENKKIKEIKEIK